MPTRDGTETSGRRVEDRRKVQVADLPFPDRRTGSGSDRRSGVDRRREDRRSPS